MDNNIFGLQPNFWYYWFVFCGIIMGGYFAAASSTYWFVLFMIDKSSLKEQIEANRQTNETVVEDIKLSIFSVILFAFAAACFIACYQRGITQIYTNWKIQDLGYLVFSYITVLLLQDAYFYFTHRLFHLPLFFKWIHQGHHLSRPPTPWTFFALEPIDAIAQAIFLLSITFIIPLHLGVLIAILLTMTVWAIGNHLGFQVVPHSRLSRWFGQWYIGSTYHLVHHQQYNQHFGLYFTLWDKFLGTHNPAYEGKNSSQ